MYYVVGSDYFETLGVPILRGRGFTAAEEQGALGPRVAVIDEPLAKALFPGEDPLGQQIYIPAKDEAEPVRGTGIMSADQGDDREAMEIVGVVAGLRHDMLDKAPVGHLYLPFGRKFRAGMHVHARLSPATPDGEAAALAALRREVRAVDERLPVLSLQTLTEHRDSSIIYWMVRAGAQMFTVFGAVAAFLAVVGLYAVKAYMVARRTREIGIRMALGSTPGNVLWLVLKEGLMLTVAGLAIGLLVAVGIGQVVGSMLYEVSPFDPLVFALAPLLLALAALAACYLPARRATRIAPVVALRTE
jgi:putative ABC transport system permease protein